MTGSFLLRPVALVMVVVLATLDAQVLREYGVYLVLVVDGPRLSGWELQLAGLSGNVDEAVAA